MSHPYHRQCGCAQCCEVEAREEREEAALESRTEAYARNPERVAKADREIIDRISTEDIDKALTLLADLGAGQCVSLTRIKAVSEAVAQHRLDALRDIAAQDIAREEQNRE